MGKFLEEGKPRVQLFFIRTKKMKRITSWPTLKKTAPCGYLVSRFLSVSSGEIKDCVRECIKPARFGFFSCEFRVYLSETFVHPRFAIRATGVPPPFFGAKRVINCGTPVTILFVALPQTGVNTSNTHSHRRPSKRNGRIYTCFCTAASPPRRHTRQ